MDEEIGQVFERLEKLDEVMEKVQKDVENTISKKNEEAEGTIL